MINLSVTKTENKQASQKLKRCSNKKNCLPLYLQFNHPNKTSRESYKNREYHHLEEYAK